MSGSSAIIYRPTRPKLNQVLRALGSPVTVARFAFTGVASFAVLDGHKITLVQIPAGSQVVDIYICLPSNTAIGGAAQELDIGFETDTEDTQNAFGTMTVAMGRASDLATRKGVGAFAAADNTEDVTIKATATNGNVSLDGLIGHVLYVLKDPQS